MTGSGMPRSLVRLSTDFKEKVWGSTHLKPWYESEGRLIGEVWFTNAPPPPLLVKFIFTEENLSVQVHPDDRFAAEHEHSRGKTEMWHILRAAPGARVALGFREEISRERLRDAVISGEIMELLSWFEARPGDTFFIPAGTVHAIGAGLVLCEVQQQSDVTYRLYDYGRGRELHLEKGLQVANRGAHPGYSTPTALPGGGTLLAECDYFRTELWTYTGSLEHHPTGESAEILVFLAGEGLIAREPFRLGEAWLNSGNQTIAIAPGGEVTMLRTFVPQAFI